MASGYYNGPTAGTPGVAASAKDYWSKQAVMLYASAAARDADAALTAVLREGMVAFLLDVNTLTVYSGSAWSTIGPGHGALTSYTPVVVQSATPTLTNTRSNSTRLGRQIIGSFNVTITSAGTAANVITITVPVAMAGGARTVVGSGALYDASGAVRFDGVLSYASSTTVKLGQLLGTGDVWFGQTSSNFAAALDTGDVLSGAFMYEAAADA